MTDLILVNLDARIRDKLDLSRFRDMFDDKAELFYSWYRDRLAFNLSGLYVSLPAIAAGIVTDKNYQEILAKAVADITREYLRENEYQITPIAKPADIPIPIAPTVPQLNKARVGSRNSVHGGSSIK